MSVVISIQFLTGRYHATPWDKQVNEGAVEWPPSPWRILRSLVAAYYRSIERADRREMLALMTALVECPPSYVLPEVTAAHTRHFMPLWKEGKSVTTKVLDTFFALPGGALSPEAIVQVVWEKLDLEPGLLGLLESLCESVGYLGRAESWVEMRVSAIEAKAPKPNAIEIPANTRCDDPMVKVLVPLNEADRSVFLAAMAMVPNVSKGRGRWTAPTDVLEMLELDVGVLHGEGWHGIPGSRWALYGMTAPPRSVGRRSGSDSVALGREKPVMARFALSSKVLPRLTAALSVGERFHQALMVWSRNDEGRSDRVFAGRDEAGKPMKADHDHAWYLPECNDRGEIVSLVVYAPGGFGVDARRALRRLEKVWGSEGFDIQTDLVSLGAVDGELEVGRLRVTGKSAVWRSLTPFVLTRFPKIDRRGNAKVVAGTGFQVDGAEDQALRLLRQLRSELDWVDGVRSADGEWLVWSCDGGEEWVRVRVVGCGVMDEGREALRYPAVRFRQERSHGQGVKSLGVGFWVEVRFAEAVVGPIALGYGAHFGLGVLVPCADGVV